ncbi:MAG: hypothetical protein SH868_08835 [Bythopirellula sp.]|nr:hypothetical protein [Bythopirellula sp.]
MTTQLKKFFVSCALVLLGAAGLIAAPYDDGYGRVWRQPATTTGYTWNAVASLCPTDGMTGCGGALQGWTWANQQQTIDLLNRFLPDTHQMTVENPGFEAYLQTPFAFTTTFAMNGAPYNWFNALRGWTSTLTTEGMGIRGTYSEGGGPVSFYAGVGVNDPFSVSQFPGYLNETGIWLWQSTGEMFGDYDDNLVVDGRDFMAWQRDPGMGSLSDWQAHFGEEIPLSAASVAIPEPGTFCLIAAVALLSAFNRPRRLRKC